MPVYSTGGRRAARGGGTDSRRPWEEKNQSERGHKGREARLEGKQSWLRGRGLWVGQVRAGR